LKVFRAALAACVLVPCGCATVPPPAPFEHRDTLGVVAIVPARYVPASNFVTFAKSRPAGAAKGAAVEGVTTAGAFAIVGASSTGMGAVALGFMAPFAIVAGAAAGAISGSLAALPAAKVIEIESILHDALARLDTQRGLAEQVTALASAEPWLARREPSVAGAVTPDDMRSYVDARVDTVIEVAVREVGFESCGPELARRLIGGCHVDAKDPAVSLYLIAQTRAVRVADRTQVYAREFRYASPQRRFAQWSADDARVLAKEFERGYRELAQRIVDEVLLAPPFELANFQSNGRLAGSDPLYGVCWLAPVHPRTQPLLLYEALQGIVLKPKDVCPTSALHFAAIDSLQPTLRWSAFPRDLDRAKLDAAWLAGISNVSYELRLWEAHGCERGRLVIERSGLALPEHRVEEPLVAGQRYFWSFRARFSVHGQPMATPWSLFDPLSCAQKDSPEWQYHRFVTPG
jgi:hypothetical protein